MIHFPNPFQKKIHYFWGYRNHILNDLDSELPIGEITLQANKDEKTVGLPLLQTLCQDFSLPIKIVAADTNFDVEEILRYIIEEIKAEAMIPRNLRNTQDTLYTMKKHRVYCQADLSMNRKGKMTVKGITYLQYCWPLYWSKDCEATTCFVLQDIRSSLSRKAVMCSFASRPAFERKYRIIHRDILREHRLKECSQGCFLFPCKGLRSGASGLYETTVRLPISTSCWLP